MYLDKETCPDLCPKRRRWRREKDDAKASRALMPMGFKFRAADC